MGSLFLLWGFLCGVFLWFFFLWGFCGVRFSFAVAVIVVLLLLFSVLKTPVSDRKCCYYVSL